jgi:hypothetical protein
MTTGETFPSYKSLSGVIQILADVLESPRSWARAKVKEVKARNINWKALKWDPPNDAAERLAFNVLKMAHAMRPLEPSMVTASAEGGIGIVYKSEQRYAALECLNSGQIWLLWFDANGEPQSEEVNRDADGIRRALAQVAAIHALHANA